MLYCYKFTNLGLCSIEATKPRQGIVNIVEFYRFNFYIKVNMEFQPMYISTNILYFQTNNFLFFMKSFNHIQEYLYTYMEYVLLITKWL